MLLCLLKCYKIVSVCLLVISLHHHLLIVLAVLDVSLVEDGALVSTGLHQVLDSSVPGHEHAVSVLCFRSEGERSLSSLLSHQREGEGDIHRLPMSLHHLVLHLHLDPRARHQAQALLAAVFVEVLIVELHSLTAPHARVGALSHLPRPLTAVLSKQKGLEPGELEQWKYTCQFLVLPPVLSS